MDELVYLFELDSVRNSPQEILRGQRALFREVALKGNRVVLSFNQLTDAESFLCAVRTPDFYEQIAALFAQGALRYSRFVPDSYRQMVDTQALSQELARCREDHRELFRREVVKDCGILPERSPQRIVRTASHYVQNAVERCLNAGGEKFLFSALPFRANDHQALSAIRYALQYSDPSILDGLAETCRDGEGGRVAFAKTYVQLILRLSREPLAYHPAKLDNDLSLEQYLMWVRTRCQTDQPPEQFPLWSLLRRGVERIETFWPAIEEREKINDRSDWYAAFRQAAGAGEDRTVLSMAEAVVDLCYNYTVAASIRDLNHAMVEEEAFWEDFLQRLTAYWEDGQAGVHQFLKPDSTDPVPPPPRKTLPRWDTAARLIRYAPRPNGAKPGEKWGRRVAASLLGQIRSAGAYIVLFTAVSLGLEVVENLFGALGDQIHVHPYVQPIISILVFGVIGSLISSWLHLLDILDSFKQFGVALVDGAVLLRAWRRERRDLNPAGPSGTDTGDRRPESPRR